MLEDFHFIRPYLLLLMIVVVWLMWCLYRKSKNSHAWSAVGDPDLLSFLLVGREKKSSALPLLLLFIVGSLLVLAIAGPAWEKLPQAVYKKEAARVFVLDMSRSMDATDVLPTRASRAKLKLIDLLKASHEGQVALIVYAADAHIVSPLTDDAETVIAMIPSLSPSIMPVQGSRTDRAILKAAQLLTQAGNHDGEIVLIGDGANGLKAIQAAEKIASGGYTLNVMGVGTEQGSPIPIEQGGFLKNTAGAIVLPKLDRSFLSELALAGSGRYVDLAVDDSDISTIIRETINNTAHMDNPLTRQVDLWQDEGHWFLLLALPFAALGFRRGWLMLVVFSVSYFPSNDLYAFEWQDLWQTKEQQAQVLMEAGEAEKAAALFDDGRWKGIAYYKDGNFEQAAEEFSKYDSVEEIYNRANALAKQGKLVEAIEAYDEVLEREPEHEDAIFNKNLVEKASENLKQQPAGDENKPGDEGEKDPDQQQESEQQQNSGDEQNSEEQPSDSEQAESEEGSESSDANEERESQEETSDDQQARQSEETEEEGETEEEQMSQEAEDQQSEQEAQEQKEADQAVQQWLRRIPDDPGGLLREKFSRQHQRQLRRQTQQTENPW